MDNPQTYGIGAICLAVVALLTWVLKNKAEQDTWVREQAERQAIALEKTANATKDLSNNVEANTKATQQMLVLLTQIVKHDGKYL